MKNLQHTKTHTGKEETQCTEKPWEGKIKTEEGLTDISMHVNC